MFLLVVGRVERGIYCTPLHIYMILAYNKQQYRIRVAFDYNRGGDHQILSTHSPERRRRRRRLLLHLNRRKVEAFIHSVI